MPPEPIFCLSSNAPKSLFMLIRPTASVLDARLEPERIMPNTTHANPHTAISSATRAAINHCSVRRLRLAPVVAREVTV